MFLTLLLISVSLLGQASSSDTLEFKLDEIKIKATRGTLTSANAPLSVSTISRSAEITAFEPALSLNYTLQTLPGVWVNNRENYALGERLSIRGMGWRAAFGVRGIYVLMDGIPLTVPDGQTVLDVIDPAFIQSAEIIRGPSSAFWGNAGGGTLFLSTRNFSSQPTAFLRSYAGSFNTYKTEAGAATSINGNNYQLFASYTDRQGYREHSKFSATRVGGNAEVRLNQDASLGINFAFVDAPDVRHPGSLNRADAETTPSAANPLFVTASAGKSWQQGQTGFRLNYQTGIGLFTATAYGLMRELHNPLPFNDIEVDRVVGGTRLSLQNSYNWLNWGVGADASVQKDDRRNYNYVDNFQRGSISLEQTETVTNTAFFAQVGTNFDRVNFHTALRADMLNFKNDDILQTGGEDQSGSRNFSALSPSLGLSYNYAFGILYTNWATAFESPTTTELVNRPDMTGGFNPELEPERTTGIEIGSRGAIPALNLAFDAALFRMQIENRLIPYQTTAGGDRVFYRNEGSTLHSGLELSLTWQPLSNLQIFSAYTWSNFIFDRPADEQGSELKNNQLPGIPEHRLNTQIQWSYQNLYLSSTLEYVGEYFTNDANTAVNDAYFVADLRAGYRNIRLTEGLQFSPFLKINNITNTRYNTSVSVNANFGRYYEPAAPRAIYAGFSLDFGMER